MFHVVGIILIVLGLIFKALPPQKINSTYGYRTRSSMKNQDTWNEAQKYSSNSLVAFGFIYVALGFVFRQMNESVNNGFGMIMFLAGMVVMIVLDEAHLRKVFNSDGSRRL